MLAALVGILSATLILPTLAPDDTLVGNRLDPKSARVESRTHLCAANKQEERAGSVTKPTSMRNGAPPVGLTVTVTGGASSRPVAIGSFDSKITVRVVSDEALSTRPTIYFMDFRWDDVTDHRLEVKTIGAEIAPPLVEGLDDTWETSLTSDRIGLGPLRLVGVLVVGTDVNGNTGTTPGVTATGADSAPLPGDAVDLGAATLFELDNHLGKPTVSLIPRSRDAATITTRANPWLRIDFEEGNEYPILNTSDGSIKGDEIVSGSPRAFVEIDSHNTVTLTSITLDGTDVSGWVSAIDDDSFLVTTSLLSNGLHRLQFDGRDAAGNTLTFPFQYQFIVDALPSTRTPTPTPKPTTTPTPTRPPLLPATGGQVPLGSAALAAGLLGVVMVALGGGLLLFEPRRRSSRSA